MKSKMGSATSMLVTILVLVFSILSFSNRSFARDHFTYDLSGGVGSYNGNNYTEAEFGLNYFALPFLAWRNAAFYRIYSGIPNQYGLDTSARFVGQLGTSALGVSAFAGPGYHFVNRGIDAPFVEGGLAVQLAGINVGAGVKSILNSAVQSGAPNDTEVFVILSGGGVF